jgi:Ras-related GTP-binding protein A/B
MRSIVFSNYVAKDTRRLGATIDVEHSHVRFLGNLTLNLWDCGGQDAFMEHYLQQQRDHIFKNVAVLIYVFDIESREFTKDCLVYSQCIEALKDNSPGARVFVLVHKMDLVQVDLRERLFEDRKGVLRERSWDMDVVFFATSIWDETLYKASPPFPLLLL